MNKYLMVFLCSFISIQLFSQGDGLIGERTLIKIDNIANEARYYIYQPSFLAKKFYKSQSEAVNASPEELFISIISATIQDWVNYNELGGKADILPQKHFQNVIKTPVDSIYFKLISKLTLYIGGIETVIIKFYFHSPGEELSGVYTFQNIAGQWYKTSITSLSKLSIVVMRMKEDKLHDVLTQHVSDPQIKELLKIIKDNTNKINLDKLVTEVNSWYSPENKKKIDFFIDPKAW